MNLTIYNTLTRQKDLFEPIEPGRVRMYVCGPTVYDKAHVGHAMSSIVFDIIRRYLEYKGYTVRHVMNYTDVDDKVIRRAEALGTAAILVVGASACPVAVAASVTAFFERENCGQCPPCAVGTANLGRIFRGAESGEARPRDLHDLAEIAGFMYGHGYCAHCRTAAAVATGLAARLGTEIERHVSEGGCPWPGRRHPDPFAPRSPERVALEAALEEQLR